MISILGTTQFAPQVFFIAFIGNSHLYYLQRVVVVRMTENSIICGIVIILAADFYVVSLFKSLTPAEKFGETMKSFTGIKIFLPTENLEKSSYKF